MNSYSELVAGSLLGEVSSKSKSVAVLLCSYNGERFLKEQVDSIFSQQYENFRVYVSDDGSRDSTLQLVDEYRQAFGESRIDYVTGPGQGFARNFLSISCRADIQADYYSWCDQDDIWHPEKLARAIEKLSAVPEGVPALYCARTELVDQEGKHIGFSPDHSRSASFRNALVQNIAGGNTMVFNHALMKLLREAGSEIPIVSHDWWAYMIVTGCGGVVLYDAVPSVLYRQHGQNCVGSNAGLVPNLTRVRQLLKGRFRFWMDQNIEALQRVSHNFTAENQRILGQFSRARRASVFSRLLRLKRSGVYRQTLLGNLGLFIAALLGRV